jgi:ABC-2 type transport system ATP-binding protein
MLPDVDDQRISEVVDIVGMDKRIHDRVKTYSLGMRQRLGIAQALLGRPRLLILDEPTNGLDPQGIKEMRRFIRSLAESGLSVFVSSHLLSEIQLMCDRVAIISHGSIIAEGKVSDLLEQYGSKVVWHLGGAAEVGTRLLRGIDQVTVLDTEEAEEARDPQLTASDSRVQIVTQMNSDLVPLANAKLVEAGVEIYSIEQKNPSLEDLFLSLTEGEAID